MDNFYEFFPATATPTSTGALHSAPLMYGGEPSLIVMTPPRQAFRACEDLAATEMYAPGCLLKEPMTSIAWRSEIDTQLLYQLYQRFPHTVFLVVTGPTTTSLFDMAPTDELGFNAGTATTRNFFYRPDVQRRTFHLALAGAATKRNETVEFQGGQDQQHFLRLAPAFAVASLATYAWLGLLDKSSRVLCTLQHVVAHLLTDVLQQYPSLWRIKHSDAARLVAECAQLGDTETMQAIISSVAPAWFSTNGADDEMTEDRVTHSDDHIASSVLIELSSCSRVAAMDSARACADVETAISVSAASEECVESSVHYVVLSSSFFGTVLEKGSDVCLLQRLLGAVCGASTVSGTFQAHDRIYVNVSGEEVATIGSTATAALDRVRLSWQHAVANYVEDTHFNEEIEDSVSVALAPKISQMWEKGLDVLALLKAYRHRQRVVEAMQASPGERRGRHKEGLPVSAEHHNSAFLPTDRIVLLFLVAPEHVSAVRRTGVLHLAHMNPSMFGVSVTVLVVMRRASPLKPLCNLEELYQFCSNTHGRLLTYVSDSVDKQSLESCRLPPVFCEEEAFATEVMQWGRVTHEHLYVCYCSPFWREYGLHGDVWLSSVATVDTCITILKGNWPAKNKNDENMSCRLIRCSKGTLIRPGREAPQYHRHTLSTTYRPGSDHFSEDGIGVVAFAYSVAGGRFVLSAPHFSPLMPLFSAAAAPPVRGHSLLRQSVWWQTQLYMRQLLCYLLSKRQASLMAFSNNTSPLLSQGSSTPSSTQVEAEAFAGGILRWKRDVFPQLEQVIHTPYFTQAVEQYAPWLRWMGTLGVIKEAVHHLLVELCLRGWLLEHMDMNVSSSVPDGRATIAGAIGSDTSGLCKCSMKDVQATVSNETEGNCEDDGGGCSPDCASSTRNNMPGHTPLYELSPFDHLSLSPVTHRGATAGSNLYRGSSPCPHPPSPRESLPRVSLDETVSRHSDILCPQRSMKSSLRDSSSASQLTASSTLGRKLWRANSVRSSAARTSREEGNGANHRLSQSLSQYDVVLSPGKGSHRQAFQVFFKDSPTSPAHSHGMDTPNKGSSFSVAMRKSPSTDWSHVRVPMPPSSLSSNSRRSSRTGRGVLGSRCGTSVGFDVRIPTQLPVANAHHTRDVVNANAGLEAGNELQNRTSADALGTYFVPPRTPKVENTNSCAFSCSLLPQHQSAGETSCFFSEDKSGKQSPICENCASTSPLPANGPIQSIVVTSDGCSSSSAKQLGHPFAIFLAEFLSSRIPASFLSTDTTLLHITKYAGGSVTVLLRDIPVQESSVVSAEVAMFAILMDVDRSSGAMSTRQVMDFSSNFKTSVASSSSQRISFAGLQPGNAYCIVYVGLDLNSTAGVGNTNVLWLDGVSFQASPRHILNSLQVTRVSSTSLTLEWCGSSTHVALSLTPFGDRSESLALSSGVPARCSNSIVVSATCSPTEVTELAPHTVYVAQVEPISLYSEERDTMVSDAKDTHSLSCSDASYLHFTCLLDATPIQTMALTSIDPDSITPTFQGAIVVHGQAHADVTANDVGAGESAAPSVLATVACPGWMQVMHLPTSSSLLDFRSITGCGSSSSSTETGSDASAKSTLRASITPYWSLSPWKTEANRAGTSHGYITDSRVVDDDGGGLAQVLLQPGMAVSLRVFHRVQLTLLPVKGVEMRNAAYQERDIFSIKATHPIDILVGPFHLTSTSVVVSGVEDCKATLRWWGTASSYEVFVDSYTPSGHCDEMRKVYTVEGELLHERVIGEKRWRGLSLPKHIDSLHGAELALDHLLPCTKYVARVECLNHLNSTTGQFITLLSPPEEASLAVTMNSVTMHLHLQIQVLPSPPGACKHVAVVATVTPLNITLQATAEGLPTSATIDCHALQSSVCPLVVTLERHCQYAPVDVQSGGGESLLRSAPILFYGVTNVRCAYLDVFSASDPTPTLELTWECAAPHAHSTDLHASDGCLDAVVLNGTPMAPSCRNQLRIPISHVKRLVATATEQESSSSQTGNDLAWSGAILVTFNGKRLIPEAASIFMLSPPPTLSERWYTLRLFGSLASLSIASRRLYDFYISASLRLSPLLSSGALASIASRVELRLQVQLPDHRVLHFTLNRTAEHEQFKLPLSRHRPKCATIGLCLETAVINSAPDATPKHVIDPTAANSTDVIPLLLLPISKSEVVEASVPKVRPITDFRIVDLTSTQVVLAWGSQRCSSGSCDDEMEALDENTAYFVTLMPAPLVHKHIQVKQSFLITSPSGISDIPTSTKSNDSTAPNRKSRKHTASCTNGRSPQPPFVGVPETHVSYLPVLTIDNLRPATLYVAVLRGGKLSGSSTAALSFVTPACISKSTLRSLVSSIRIADSDIQPSQRNGEQSVVHASPCLHGILPPSEVNDYIAYIPFVLGDMEAQVDGQYSSANSQDALNSSGTEMSSFVSPYNDECIVVEVGSDLWLALVAPSGLLLRKWRHQSRNAVEIEVDNMLGEQPLLRCPCSGSFAHNVDPLSWPHLELYSSISLKMDEHKSYSADSRPCVLPFVPTSMPRTRVDLIGYPRIIQCDADRWAVSWESSSSDHLVMWRVGIKGEIQTVKVKGVPYTEIVLCRSPGGTCSSVSDAVLLVCIVSAVSVSNCVCVASILPPRRQGLVTLHRCSDYTMLLLPGSAENQAEGEAPPICTESGDKGKEELVNTEWSILTPPLSTVSVHEYPTGTSRRVAVVMGLTRMSLNQRSTDASDTHGQPFLALTLRAVASVKNVEDKAWALSCGDLLRQSRQLLLTSSGREGDHVNPPSLPLLESDDDTDASSVPWVRLKWLMTRSVADFEDHLLPLRDLRDVQLLGFAEQGDPDNLPAQDLELAFRTDDVHTAHEISRLNELVHSKGYPLLSVCLSWTSTEQSFVLTLLGPFECEAVSGVVDDGDNQADRQLESLANETHSPRAYHIYSERCSMQEEKKGLPSSITGVPRRIVDVRRMATPSPSSVEHTVWVPGLAPQSFYRVLISTSACRSTILRLQFITPPSRLSQSIRIERSPEGQCMTVSSQYFNPHGHVSCSSPASCLQLAPGMRFVSKAAVAIKNARGMVVLEQEMVKCGSGSVSSLSSASIREQLASKALLSGTFTFDRSTLGNSRLSLSSIITLDVEGLDQLHAQSFLEESVWGPLANLLLKFDNSTIPFERSRRRVATVHLAVELPLCSVPLIPPCTPIRLVQRTPHSLTIDWGSTGEEGGCITPAKGKQCYRVTITPALQPNRNVHELYAQKTLEREKVNSRCVVPMSSQYVISRQTSVVFHHLEPATLYNIRVKPMHCSDDNTTPNLKSCSDSYKGGSKIRRPYAVERYTLDEETVQAVKWLAKACTEFSRPPPLRVKDNAVFINRNCLDIRALTQPLVGNVFMDARHADGTWLNQGLGELVLNSDVVARHTSLPVAFPFTGNAMKGNCSLPDAPLVLLYTMVVIVTDRKLFVPLDVYLWSQQRLSSRGVMELTATRTSGTGHQRLSQYWVSTLRAALVVDTPSALGDLLTLLSRESESWGVTPFRDGCIAASSSSRRTSSLAREGDDENDATLSPHQCLSEFLNATDAGGESCDLSGCGMHGSGSRDVVLKYNPVEVGTFFVFSCAHAVTEGVGYGEGVSSHCVSDSFSVMSRSVP